MGLCVSILPDGTLVATGEPLDSCSAFWMLEPSEVLDVQTVATWLEIPPIESVSSGFVGVFGFVVGCYVIGRIVGHVISLFK